MKRIKRHKRRKIQKRAQFRLLKWFRRYAPYKIRRSQLLTTWKKRIPLYYFGLYSLCTYRLKQVHTRPLLNNLVLHSYVHQADYFPTSVAYLDTYGSLSRLNQFKQFVFNKAQRLPPKIFPTKYISTAKAKQLVFCYRKKNKKQPENYQRNTKFLKKTENTIKFSNHSRVSRYPRLKRLHLFQREDKIKPHKIALIKQYRSAKLLRVAVRQKKQQKIQSISIQTIWRSFIYKPQPITLFKKKRKQIGKIIFNKVRSVLPKISKQLLKLLYNYFFNFILKHNLIFALDYIFFKQKKFEFSVSFKNLKSFFLSNHKVQKHVMLLERKRLPLRFYNRQFFYFSLVCNYCLMIHNIHLLLVYFEKFLRRVFGRRKFISNLCNLLRFFKKQYYLFSWCFLMRGTIEKHGRTITFFVIEGKLSLQTFINLIFYEYIQCYQKHGVFSLHLWLRYFRLSR